MIESSLGMNTMIIIVNVHVNVNKVCRMLICSLYTARHGSGSAFSLPVNGKNL